MTRRLADRYGTPNEESHHAHTAQAEEMAGIKFMVKEGGERRLKHTVMVDAAEPSELSRVVIKYLQKGMGSLIANIEP